MTLIACFFILMTAFSTFDNSNFSQKAKVVGQYFQGSAGETGGDKVKKAFLKLNANSEITDLAQTKIDPNGITIVLSSENFFDSGKAELKKRNIKIIQNIANLLSPIQEQVKILIEGHTDSIPLSKNNRFLNNRELSFGRASHIIQYFEEVGFSKKVIVTVGYGDSFPKEKEFDKNGKHIPSALAANRRILIRVLRKSGDLVPFGFGMYFQH